MKRGFLKKHVRLLQLVNNIMTGSPGLSVPFVATLAVLFAFRLLVSH